MSSPTAPAVNTVIGRDCSLLSIQNLSVAGGTPPAAVSFLGSFEKVSLRLKRGNVSIMGAADTADYFRATHWESGSVTLEGFMRGTASSYAAIFAAGSQGLLQFTDVATGDNWQQVIFLEEFGKEVGGKTPTKDTITAKTVGPPYLNGTAIPLE